MFNQTIQHHFILLYRSPEKTIVLANTTAASREEAIDKLYPHCPSAYRDRSRLRARRNIIHRVYTTL